MDQLSRKILEEYSCRQSMNLLQLSAVLNTDLLNLPDPVNYLWKKGLLQIERNYEMLHREEKLDLLSPSTPLEISYLGLVTLENDRKMSREKRNELIRYIITTAIAVAAFLKSFFFPG